MLARSILFLYATFTSAFSLANVRVSTGTTLTRRELSVTQAQLTGFEFYAGYAAAGYCNSANTAGEPITCSNSGCVQAEADGAITVASFSGLITGIAGFVATDPVSEQIIVVIRGSTNVRNWIADALFDLSACDDLVSGCEVHFGFQESWKEISDDLIAAVKTAQAANPGYAVVATGHSLGAAVVTIAAAYLRQQGICCNIYTFGSPRVGNDIFANFVDAQAGVEYRVTHLDDPVPRLPPLDVGYRHTSPEYWLDDGTADTNTYGTGDIEVCPGTANITCNASTGGFDTEAHLHYFQTMDACASPGIGLKRQSTVSDKELEARLRLYTAMDKQYVASLKEEA